MRTDGVEIAEQDHGERLICLGSILQDLFHHDLCPAVRVGTGATLHFLGVGNRVFFSVNRCAGREDDVVHLVFLHTFQERQRGVDVVAVIEERFLYRFAHCLQTGKMDDSIDVVFLENRFQLFAVLDIDFIQLYRFSGDLLHTLYCLRAAVGIVVGNDNLETGIQKFNRSVTADVSGAACKQDRFHGVAPFLLSKIRCIPCVHF